MAFHQMLTRGFEVPYKRPDGTETHEHVYLGMFSASLEWFAPWKSLYGHYTHTDEARDAYLRLEKRLSVELKSEKPNRQI